MKKEYLDLLKKSFFILAAVIALGTIAYTIGFDVGSSKVDIAKLECEINLKKIGVENVAELSNLKNKINLLESKIISYQDRIAFLYKSLEEYEKNNEKLLNKIDTLYSEKEKLMSNLNNLRKEVHSKRPYLFSYIDKNIEQNKYNHVVFKVVNNGNVNAKVVGTNSVNIMNGNVKLEPKSVKAILTPEKNGSKSSFLYFNYKYGDVNKKLENNSEYRGGLCVKYTTQDRNDSRYWIYALTFEYEHVRDRFRIVDIVDRRSTSKEVCEAKKFF